MPLLTRKPLSNGTSFLQSIKVASGQSFKAPYSLELKLKAAASLSVNLIPAGSVTPSHTVVVKSKAPGWITFHFLLGPSNAGPTAFGDFAVEIKNLVSGQQVVIEEGQLTYGATMVVPHDEFESRLCQDAFTTAECLGILKAEVEASRSIVAALPYLMEWESVLKKRFADKGTDAWSEGNRDEFNTLVDGVMGEAQDQIQEELMKRMEYDLIVESIEETLKMVLPVMVRGMLPWLERAAAFSVAYDATAAFFGPSVTATDHQMAVLSGEAALYVPIRARFLEQMPVVHRVLADAIIVPGPTIGPKP
jgi:hypothetical protein